LAVAARHKQLLNQEEMTVLLVVRLVFLPPVAAAGVHTELELDLAGPAAQAAELGLQ
jgi:hypothetical protein